jgi:hypothetical protein
VATSVFAVTPAKTYKHVAEFQMGTLDKNLRVSTGSDVTLGHTTTDAKLDQGGQGMHFLHTEKGDFRVEAPVNKGRSFLNGLAAASANMNRPVWAQERGEIVHNKWFLDNVQAGTNVLFASECAAPNKKHPNETVRCSFYFPDPDSTDHEYATSGDFTPYLQGDGSNTQKAGDTLCGTGKLKPEVESQLCGASLATAKPEEKTAAPVSAGMNQ